MSRPGVSDDGVLVVSVVVDDGGHGLPRVLDVVKVAPDVARVDDRGVVGLEYSERYSIRSAVSLI